MNILKKIIKERKKPKLSLVGAGPGDADLITLKGIKTLKQADVVLYDALVNPELLDYAPDSALKICVGKRAGSEQSFEQEEINRLIVEYAYTHGHVVRLKGGDPTVFGRAVEELDYAESFGVETAIVPGISSALALPALQKIPLTQRGLSESFWVLTGTTQSHQLSTDLHLAAQSSATLVILMGLHKLTEITTIFRRLGKNETPVMIIQNGSLPDEKIALGIIDTIAKVVEEKGIGSPALIVIGEVLNRHPQLEEFKKIVNEQFASI